MLTKLITIIPSYEKLRLELEDTMESKAALSKENSKLVADIKSLEQQLQQQIEQSEDVTKLKEKCMKREEEKNLLQKEFEHLAQSLYTKSEELDAANDHVKQLQLTIQKMGEEAKYLSSLQHKDASIDVSFANYSQQSINVTLPETIADIKIAELETEKAKLAEENRIQKSKLIEMEESLGKASKVNKEQDIMIEGLKYQLDNSTQKNDSLSVTIDLKTKELSRITTKLKYTEHELKESKDSCREKDDDIEHLNEILSQLKWSHNDAVSKYKEELAELRSSMEDLKSEYEAVCQLRDVKRDEHKKGIELLKQKFTDKTNKLEQVNANLQQEVTLLQSSIREKTEAYDAVCRQRDQQQSEIESLNQELSKHHDFVNKQLEDQHNKVEMLNKIIEGNANHIDEQINQLQKGNDNLQQKLQQEQAESEQKIQLLKEEFDSFIEMKKKQFDEQQQCNKQEMDKLTERFDSMLYEKVKLEVEKEAIEAKFKSFETKSVKEIAQLKEKLMAKTAEVHQISQESKRHEETYQKMNMEKEVSQTIIETLKKELTVVQSMLDEVNQSFESKHSETLKLKKNNDKLEQSQAQHQHSIKELKQQLEARNVIVDKLNTEIEQVKSENCKLKNTIESLQNAPTPAEQAKERKDRQMRKLEKELELERSSYDAQEKIKAQLLKDNMRLEKELSKLRKQIDESAAVKHPQPSSSNLSTRSTSNTSISTAQSHIDQLSMPAPPLPKRGRAATASGSSLSLPEMMSKKVPFALESCDEEGEYMGGIALQKTVGTERFVSSDHLDDMLKVQTDEDRIRTLMHRNSMMQPHMRSTYATELQMSNFDEISIKNGSTSTSTTSMNTRASFISVDNSPLHNQYPHLATKR